MICKTCAIAGDMVAEVRDKPILNTPAVVSASAELDVHDAVRIVAHIFHGLCIGCDCQHKIDFKGKTIQ